MYVDCTVFGASCNVPVVSKECMHDGELVLQGFDDLIAAFGACKAH